MNWWVEFREGALVRRRFVVACVVVGALLSCGAGSVQAVEPPIVAVAFDREATRVILGSQNGIQVREWPRLEPVATKLQTKLARVHDLAISPDGKWLAVAGGEPAVRGVVEVWRWPSEERAASFEVSDDVVYAIDWEPNGERLVCGCSDNHLSVLDVAAGTNRRIDGHSKAVFAVAALAEQQGWLSGGADRSFRWWRHDVGLDGQPTAPRRTMNNHTGEVSAIAVRPGEWPRPTVATAGWDRTVRIWQPTIGRLVRFARLSSKPLAIAWTADGRQLAAACVDGKVRLIDPDTVEILAEHEAVDRWAYCLAAAPDGSGFVVGGAGGQVHRVSSKR